MSIILPNLNHSFISPVPVPVPVPDPDFRIFHTPVSEGSGTRMRRHAMHAGCFVFERWLLELRTTEARFLQRHFAYLLNKEDTSWPKICLAIMLKRQHSWISEGHLRNQ